MDLSVRVLITNTTTAIAEGRRDVARLAGHAGKPVDGSPAWHARRAEPPRCGSLHAGCRAGERLRCGRGGPQR
jgi:hypothetical protein